MWESNPPRTESSPLPDLKSGRHTRTYLLPKPSLAWQISTVKGTVKPAAFSHSRCKLFLIKIL